MTPVLVFDIETIPDAQGLRVLHADERDGTESSDEAIVQEALDARREKTGSDFLPLPLQRIVAISCVFRDHKDFRVRSLGKVGDSESTLIQSFFRIIEKYTPQLISWNGGGFDLPVLHYRSLLHGIAAPRYWDIGEEDREFKWNNYLNRYHMRHLDLMDHLALYQPKAYASLDLLAKLLGFPGKLGMDGSQVWPAYQAGKIEEIRQYCETDVVNTYLLYARFQLMRGHFSQQAYESELSAIRETLTAQPEAHWREYLQAWSASERSL